LKRIERSAGGIFREGLGQGDDAHGAGAVVVRSMINAAPAARPS